MLARPYPPKPGCIEISLIIDTVAQVDRFALNEPREKFQPTSKDHKRQIRTDLTVFFIPDYQPRAALQRSQNKRDDGG